MRRPQRRLLAPLPASTMLNNTLVGLFADLLLSYIPFVPFVSGNQHVVIALL